MKVLSILMVIGGFIWTVWNFSKYRFKFSSNGISWEEKAVGATSGANLSKGPASGSNPTKPDEHQSLLGASRSILPREVVTAAASQPVPVVVPDSVRASSGMVKLVTSADSLVSDESEINVPQGQHEFNEPVDGVIDTIETDEPETEEDNEGNQETETAVEDEYDSDLDLSLYRPLSDQMGEKFGYPIGESEVEPDKSFLDVGLGEDAFESDDLDELIDNETAVPLDKYMDRIGVFNSVLKDAAKMIKRSQRKQTIEETVRQAFDIAVHYKIENDTSTLNAVREAFYVVQDSPEKTDWAEHYIGLMKEFKEGPYRDQTDEDADELEELSGVL